MKQRRLVQRSGGKEWFYQPLPVCINVHRPQAYAVLTPRVMPKRRRCLKQSTGGAARVEEWLEKWSGMPRPSEQVRRQARSVSSYAMSQRGRRMSGCGDEVRGDMEKMPARESTALGSEAPCPSTRARSFASVSAQVRRAGMVRGGAQAAARAVVVRVCRRG